MQWQHLLYSSPALSMSTVRTSHGCSAPRPLGKFPWKFPRRSWGRGGKMLCHLPGSHVSAEVMGLATALLQVVNQLAMWQCDSFPCRIRALSSSWRWMVNYLWVQQHRTGDCNQGTTIMSLKGVGRKHLWGCICRQCQGKLTELSYNYFSNLLKSFLQVEI